MILDLPIAGTNLPNEVAIEGASNGAKMMPLVGEASAIDRSWQDYEQG